MKDFGLVRIYYDETQKTDKFSVEDSKVFDTLTTLLTSYLELMEHQFYNKLNIEYRVNIEENIFTILVLYGDTRIDSFGLMINKFVTPEFLRGLTKPLSYLEALTYINQSIGMMKSIGKVHPFLDEDKSYVDAVLAHIGHGQAASTLDTVLKEADDRHLTRGY